MKTDYKNTPIFITGTERSGSSIIARIFANSGTYTGVMTDMYESVEIKKHLDLYYAYVLGVDPAGQFPLPNRKSFNHYHDAQVLKNKINHNFLPLLELEQPWMYKSSKLAQTWPMWYSLYPNAKWIIVRRRTSDIIQSCLKTGYMNAYSDQEGWLGWVRKHEEMFVEMIQEGLNCKVVWPERMATGDFQQIQETIEWTGLQWDDKIIDIVKPLFEHSPQRRKEV